MLSQTVRCSLPALFGVSLAVLAPALGPAHAQTLSDVLATAYTTSPKLEAERARLRATDEDVARALAGYRPTVRAVADLGYARDTYDPASRYTGGTRPAGYRLALSQTVFDGFKTMSNVSSAEARVAAAREMLRATETQVLNDIVASYIAVIRDDAIQQLRLRHVQNLETATTAIKMQKQIGDKTLTDVAQAEARFAAARSTLDAAIVALHASKANYRRLTGVSPGALVMPGVPATHLPSNIEEAIGIALAENPAVTSAVLRERSAKFDIDAARADFLPSVTFDAVTRSRTEENRLIDKHSETSFTGSIVVPIYTGGAESARLRASKQQQIGRLQDIDQARQDVEAGVIQAWSRYLGARSRRMADDVQVRSALTALKGVREEEKNGLRTSLDVLNAQQDVIIAQVALETSRADIVIEAYALLAAVGRFSPERVANVAAYDATANLAAVRDVLWGEGPAGDVTADRPGRNRDAVKAAMRLTTATTDERSSDRDDATPPGGLLQWLGTALAGATPTVAHP